ncbi:heparinase II/III domain-containing protein [Nitratidesulfovibrio sp. D1]|uniref:heparinase II/III domain-containing protein n=1 Tax=Nitratidesulfovibrio sp. D1 TaxID=3440151 RepID=UPI003EB6FF49
MYIFPLDTSYTEYVFAPLFDPEHSGGIKLSVDAESRATVSCKSDWCFVRVVWQNSQLGGPAAVVRCLAEFAPVAHDQLIVSFALPREASISFALLGPAGKKFGRWSEPFSGTGVRQEVVIDIDHLLAGKFSLRSLARLVGLRPRPFAGVALRIDSPEAPDGTLALSWVGARNSAAHAALVASRALRQPDWTPWIKAPEGWGEVTIQRGLLFGTEELARVRARRHLPGWKEHFALLEQKAAQLIGRDPEHDFGEYLPNHDLRFTRVRADDVRAYHWDALVLAFVGLVNEDRRLLSHALRYLMCMLHTPNWADSAEQRIPSSTWTQRAFMEEMTTTSVAILVDWLGFALTPRTFSLVRQALWTRGMAYVQHDLFKYDYMHRMNQGAVFCRALVLGGLTMEQSWPRAAGVVDQAYDTMKRVLRTYIQPDGGIAEGPGYLCQTLTATLWTTIAYCRARNLDWRAEAKDLFGNIENYLRVMAAGEPGKCIPSGDCRIEWFCGDGIPILAEVFPDSAYSNILMPCLQAGWVHEMTGTLRGSGGMIGMAYGPDHVGSGRCVPASDSWLPDTGKLSHVCVVDGHRARLWATTSRCGATHSHLDHGSIVLEVDEAPLFVDRGMAEYWKVDLTCRMRRSFAHNTLTPVLPDGAFADQSPPSANARQPIAPDGGNVLLRIPSESVWPEHMTCYERVLATGGSRATWLVQDIGALRTPGRVAFHLHGPHAFTVRGKAIEIELEETRCTVEFPWADDITVEESLPDCTGRAIFHVCAVSEALTAFDLETFISIRANGSGAEA